MCTVSWIRTPCGYELFCNRDEKRKRQPAIGPHITEQDGVAWVAPIDGDFGGTWIGVNHLGLTVCLLNGTPADGTPGPISRGFLTRELLSSRTMDEAIERLDEAALENYSAFTLIVLAVGRPAIAAAWDRNHLVIHTHAERLQPYTSSSYESDSVVRYRRASYEHARLHGIAFHASHQFGRSPWSVCMHRDDAETVSFTGISVNRRHVCLLYSSGAPCTGIRGTPVSLPRVA